MLIVVLKLAFYLVFMPINYPDQCLDGLDGALETLGTTHIQAEIVQAVVYHYVDCPVSK